MPVGVVSVIRDLRYALVESTVSRTVILCGVFGAFKKLRIAASVKLFSIKICLSDKNYIKSIDNTVCLVYN